MEKFSRSYFLGIGGIGMSALARYLHVKGYAVAGYDHMETSLTNKLQKEGIDVCYDDTVEQIPENFLSPESCLVVYTPAIPSDSVQLNYFRERGFEVMKRSELLGLLTQRSKCICIAGTHGKTTTTTIAAHLLHQSAVGCSAFLGGISNNYNSNLLLSKESNLMLIEADEYDRSFHNLSPSIALITSLDADHLDIYGTAEEFKRGFEIFASLVYSGGSLIVKKGIDFQPTLKKNVKVYTYSMDNGGDFYAENIRFEKDEIRFDCVAKTTRIVDLRLRVPIKINVENCVAAIAIAWLNGVSEDEIRMGIYSYSGIQRRFNVIYKDEKTVYIDDYAHHPQELKASIESIRALFPERKITGIFQPHLYTRTRDFANDFSKTLSQLDELILLDIYPARELPIEGVTSKIIFDNVELDDKTLLNKNELISFIKNKTYDVLVTFGAGDIDKLVPQIKLVLEN
jgi:UDP-N-acetylmuramate--alanine ligase